MFKIKRDNTGCTFPKNAPEIVLEAVRDFGHIIDFDESITIPEFIKRIKEIYNNEKADSLTKQLIELYEVTAVIHNGSSKESKVIFKYPVLGEDLDEAINLAGKILDKEVEKTKYLDNVERLSAVKSLQGGIITSGLILNGELA